MISSAHRFTSARMPLDQHDELPKISVVIPVRPTETDADAIGSLREMDYPAGRIEVLVVRGTQPSKQRNIGIESATGDIVYFLDNDSAAAKDLFRRVAEHCQNAKVIGVGGPNLSSPTPGVVPSAIDAVFCSPFGTGSIRARYSSVGEARIASEHDIIFCNLAIRKPALAKAGGLNEELYPNEENELFERLLETFPDSHFVYDPAAVVRRPRTDSIFAHVRQISCYGIGRMKQTFYRPNFLCLFHMMPAAFLIYLLVVPWLPFWWSWLPIAAYGTLVLLFSIREGVRMRSPAVSLLLPLLFPLTHLAYGVGLLIGFLRYAFLRWRPRVGSAELFVVKSFGKDFSDS